MKRIKSRMTPVLSVMVATWLALWVAGCSCTAPDNESKKDASAADSSETAVRSEEEAGSLIESGENAERESLEEAGKESSLPEQSDETEAGTTSSGAVDTTAEPTGLVVDPTSEENVAVLVPDDPSTAAPESSAPEESASSTESESPSEPGVNEPETTQTEEEKWGPLL